MMQVADSRPELPVRVVIVNFRSEADVQRLLESGALAGCDVILVDNASDPRRISHLAQAHGAKALLLEDNLGFARGVNHALRESRAAEQEGLTLLLNPDLALSGLQLSLLRKALIGGGFDAVGPVLVDQEGREWVSSAGGPMTLRSVVTYFAGICHLLPNQRGFFWSRKQVRRGGAEPAWLCGACLLVNNGAWLRFGMLPEEEHMYAEDVAWGTSATAKGARLSLVNDVVVEHFGGGSGGADRWIDATCRLLRRRLGRVRGALAVAVVRSGLGARRMLRSLTR